MLRPMRSALSVPRPPAEFPAHRVPAILALATACAFAQAPGAQAQAPADSARGDAAGVADSTRRAAGVRDTVTVLPQVEVTRPRVAIPERSTVTNVRLNRGDMSRFLPATVGDALLAVPGVELVKTGPWASLISVRGLSGDRVVLMVDGVRMNTVRGHGVQPSLVALDRLDAVEVMPGASSAQYGSDALGGAVNLVTHHSLLAGTPTFGGNVSVRGSEPGAAYAQQATMRYGTARWGIEAQGGLGQMSALITPAGRLPNSGDHEWNLGLRAMGQLAGGLLDLEHTTSRALDIGLPAFDNDAGSRGVYPLQGRDAERLEYVHPLHGALSQARVLAVTQRLANDFTETTVDSVFLRGRFVGRRETVAADRVRTRASEVDPSLKLAGPGHVRLTGEWRLEQALGPRTEDVTVSNLWGNVTSQTQTLGESVPHAWRQTWSAAAFGGGAWRGTHGEAGLRWDAMRSHADSTAQSFTSRLDARDDRVSAEGGVSRPFGPLEPYAHLATGFRAPNLDERYYDDDVHGGLRLFGNPDLRSERSLAMEGGVRIGPMFDGRIASARVSAYRSEVRDLITFHYIGQLYLIPRFQYWNVNRARIEGMEYALEAHVAPVTLGVSAAFPRGYDLATGERLATIGTGRVVIDASVPVHALPQGLFAARMRWNDAVWTRDTTLARPRFTTFAVEGSATWGGVRVTLAVRNLFDASYREPGSFIPEPGRTFAFAVRRDFTRLLGPEDRD
jgi:hemoglobin/transferrin/lactoferrin receptor protein